MADRIRRCSFCDRLEGEQRFFGAGSVCICEICLSGYHRFLTDGAALHNQLRFRCPTCRAFSSHGLCPHCHGILTPAGDILGIPDSGRAYRAEVSAMRALARIYTGLAEEILRNHFHERLFYVTVSISTENGTMSRRVKVETTGGFGEEGIESVQWIIRQGLGLAEKDRVTISASDSSDVYLTSLPSGRSWALQLLGLSHEQAARLLLRKDSEDLKRKDDVRSPCEKDEMIREALLVPFRRSMNAVTAYSHALVTLLSGLFRKCRSCAQKASSEPAVSCEAANILAILNIEERGRRGIPAAMEILRRNIPLRSSRDVCGKVLRYNLARLLEEDELPGAEDLYREIFHSDWNFLDVRERLRTFSPETIALAECRRNLHTLAATLGNWHRMINAFPGALEDLVPTFLSSIPVCPVSSMEYEYRREPDCAVILCAGHHHVDCGLAADEPSLTIPAYVNGNSENDENGEADMTAEDQAILPSLQDE